MRKSRLNWFKQCKLMELFVAGSTARCAAQLVGVNRKTSAYYFHRLRQIIAYHLELESDEVVGGEIEVDESYFGGRRKGKRGRGSAGKVPVFGLLKRGGKVYTKIIADARSATLMPIIKRKVFQTALFIPIAGEVIMLLMFQSSNTFESIIQSCLPMQRITSMG